MTTAKGLQLAPGLVLPLDFATKSGGFNNPCGRLRSLGLIDYPAPGHAVASGVLFPSVNT
jgi:hypothetical protein